MQLKGKVIYILSQQPWGEMFISKHHYAVELARLGNKVFYINGPDQEGILKPGQVAITPTGIDGLACVTHRLFFPYFFKFKARAVYDYLLRFHIRNIIKKTGTPDVVWSFDLSDTMPLRMFPVAAKKIYMPVDELNETTALKAAQTADIIYSVTYEILDKFKSYAAPKVFLNHGVASQFLNNDLSAVSNGPIQVGLSGNFLRPDIDRPTLLNIIKQHPKVIFNFWGSIDHNSSNLVPYEDEAATNFINALRQLPNVKLHGQVAPVKLAEEMKQMDCFLICYDIQKDQSGGTNYHKILEYLATGKVVVSNNVTTYAHYPGMIEMTSNRNNNSELPALFSKVINNIGSYNALTKQQERVAFATRFTYHNQLKRIEADLKA